MNQIFVIPFSLKAKFSRVAEYSSPLKMAYLMIIIIFLDFIFHNFPGMEMKPARYNIFYVVNPRVA